MNELRQILYAEDNPNDAELTMAAFQETGLKNEIDIVNDGEDAINYLFYKEKYADRKKSIPAFVLLDIKMPKLTGIDVLKKIRETEDYKTLPVIMLTSSKMESDILECYKHGANGFVVKPIDFDEFINTIKGIGYFWGVLNTTLV